MNSRRLAILLFSATTALTVRADEPTGAKELFGGGLTREVVGFDEQKPATPQKPPSDQKKKKAAPAFGLSCWIELVEGPGRGGTQVVHTRNFRSGEKIRLHFTGNADGYIALVQLGTSGTSSVLFPDPAHGLADNALRSGADRILPSEKHWFRFDVNAGTEHLLVLYAKTRRELDQFVKDRAMDLEATAAMLQVADSLSGSKDLVTETVEDEATYVVNRVGDLIVMRLALVHQ